MNTIRSTSDRRRTTRFLTTIPIEIRFSTDGTPMDASCIEIGPNGMRVLTQMPLVEATYVHVLFRNASNSTHCEGRVVWTQRSEDDERFESGIDVQHWGGGIPGQDVVEKIPKLKAKKDRRRRLRS